MKKLLEQRYLVRKNLVTLIGIGLFVYFSYHLILGERSLIRYMTLEKSVATLEKQSFELAHDHEQLEKKVSMMRPGSINKDLLEERARIVLGFRRPGEVDVLSSKN